MVVNAILGHTHGGLHSLRFNRYAFIQAVLQFSVHLHQDTLGSVDNTEQGFFEFKAADFG